MIQSYRTKCSRPTGETPATERARGTTSSLLSETRLVTDRAERHPAYLERPSGPPTYRASRLSWDWEMITAWILVVLSFAACIFAGYIIWAKCHGNSF